VRICLLNWGYSASAPVSVNGHRRYRPYSERIVVEIVHGRGLVFGGNSVSGGDGGEENAGLRVATPIFDALLTEFELEWPCDTAWDPDAPNAWFEPATPPDPAAVADG
jgi:hypothetical protein